MPRLYCPVRLAPGASLALPAAAARHVQVLRLQPGEAVTLFNGEGGQWQAVVERMGRSDVQVRVGTHEEVERENAVRVHLAIGMPTNERMDWLVEKAGELGAASIQPLVTARGVLRVAGERAQKKREHWQAIAAAASEQCGRNRVTAIHEPMALADWLDSMRGAPGAKVVLSLAKDARAVADSALAGGDECIVLSGPEGGLEEREEEAAFEAGFAPVSLGPRTLRAETAPLALLALLALGPSR
jgi:16S rRNA (uracil1498-N3)-methyltransferase